jgi:hypothetical protein
VLREGRFRLIETAAERVAERLLADFPLTWLRLELRKPITSARIPAPSAAPATPALRSDANPGTPTPPPDASPVASVAPPAYIAVVTIERTREISLS